MERKHKAASGNAARGLNGPGHYWELSALFPSVFVLAPRPGVCQRGDQECSGKNNHIPLAMFKLSLTYALCPSFPFSLSLSLSQCLSLPFLILPCLFLTLSISPLYLFFHTLFPLCPLWIVLSAFLVSLPPTTQLFFLVLTHQSPVSEEEMLTVLS